jgi:hypothetical protein
VVLQDIAVQVLGNSGAADVTACGGGTSSSRCAKKPDPVRPATLPPSLVILTGNIGLGPQHAAGTLAMWVLPLFYAATAGDEICFGGPQ